MALEKILVVGRHPKAHTLARPFTRKLYAADEAADIWQLIESVEPNLILCDADIPFDDIYDTLAALRQKELSVPVVFICPEQQAHRAEELIEAGAHSYISGYGDTARMGQIIDRIENPSSTLESRFFIEDCPSKVSIVGKSPAIFRTIRMIRTVATSNCNPILIVGETGTGKELAARAMHIVRHGSDQKFVAINCAALTANLLESELFGHVKGSFTSADREKTGLLELAGSGTIFLDEISEMPLDLQAKLLRVIQERTFRKVGGIEELECRATVIASSNRNLLKEVEKNRFRPDLYYRLSICPITLAPLRTPSRKDDILLLAEYFILNSEICPAKKGKIKGLTKLAAETLQRHLWPGNVRELRNVIERAILLENSDRIGTSNLIFNPEYFEEEACASRTPACGPDGLTDFSLEKAEKELVKRALEQAGWQKTRAAALLGITRATLYAKVKQYNIQEPASCPEKETVSI
ncbi:MAG: sigma-54 dependent transcriptional regulator [Planctomycetaceae bacterium]|nr:sigma-54 dependent transcriptional regulator [Planctomycetaceae bacterium]